MRSGDNNFEIFSLNLYLNKVLISKEDSAPQAFVLTLVDHNIDSAHFLVLLAPILLAYDESLDLSSLDILHKFLTNIDNLSTSETVNSISVYELLAFYVNEDHILIKAFYFSKHPLKKC